ncbi:hypothetical protein BJ741DRAFT_596984 [Chytriomyces cf. hyalinus JEL632]|nr:hypothetical protein BJ741DRAFT_596984 [Chytriomyces cf. hyalinus JEL632]
MRLICQLGLSPVLPTALSLRPRISDCLQAATLLPRASPYSSNATPPATRRRKTAATSTPSNETQASSTFVQKIRRLAVILPSYSRRVSSRFTMRVQNTALALMTPLYGIELIRNEGGHVVNLKKDRRRTEVNYQGDAMSLKYISGDVVQTPEMHLHPITVDQMNYINKKIKNHTFMHSRWNDSKFQRLLMACRMFNFMRQNSNYQKIHSVHRCTAAITLHQRNHLWTTAPVAYGFDPAMFRRDVLGSLVCKIHNNRVVAGGGGAADDNASATTTESRIFPPLAYDIEHIIPRSHGGRTCLDNLCILNASTNRFKRDAHLFLCGLPDIYDRVKQFIVDPEEVRRTFNSYDGERKCREIYRLDLVKNENGLLDWNPNSSFKK